MPQHKILIGGGAGKFLPFARNHLADLRKHIGIHAYSNTVAVEGASIHVRWSGDQEHIRIIAVGDEFFGYREDFTKSLSSRYTVGAFKPLPLGVDTTPPTVFLSTLIPTGSREALLLGRQNVGGPTPRLYTVYKTTDGGLSVTPLIQRASSFINGSLTYGGLVRDGSGTVIGKRYVLLRESFGDGLHDLTISEDSGATWTDTVVDDTFPVGGDHQMLLPVFVGGNKFVSVVQRDAGGGAITAKVMLSDDGGSTWSVVASSPIEDDLESGTSQAGILFGSLNMVAVNDIGTVVAVATFKFHTFTDPTYRVYSSADFGQTWVREPDILPNNFGASQTQLFALHDDAVFFMFKNVDGEAVIARSFDAGSTWDTTSTILPGTTFVRFSEPTVYRRGAADPPTNPAEKVGIIMPIFSGGKTRLYVSEDSGMTWKAGAVIDLRDTAPTFFGQYVFNIVHLGTRARPQAASIALPALYANPL